MRKGRPSNSRGLHIAAIDMNLSPISPQTLRRNRDATLLDFREALTGPSSLRPEVDKNCSDGANCREVSILVNRKTFEDAISNARSEERRVGKECVSTWRKRVEP